MVIVSSSVSARKLGSSISSTMPPSVNEDTDAADRGSSRKRRHSSMKLDGREDGREAELSDSCVGCQVSSSQSGD